MDDVDEPALAPDVVHHLERVLRLRSGATVTVSDGRGGWRSCAMAGGGRLEPLGPVHHVPAPTPSLAVAFAVTKGARPEVAVQKLTEVGVDVITPFHAQRSVARWDTDRAGRHLERLRRVALEAAVQSRRAWLPEVTDLADLTALLAAPGTALADAGGGPPTLAHPRIVVGPEGGFSDAERSAAQAAVRLGPLVLRAESAAIVAGAILAGLRDGVVAPVDTRAGGPT